MARTLVLVIMISFALAAPTGAAAPKDDRPEAATKEPPGQVKKTADTPPTDPSPIDEPAPAPEPTATTTAPAEAPQAAAPTAGSHEAPTTPQPQPAQGVTPQAHAAETALPAVDEKPDGSGDAQLPAAPLLPSTTMDDAGGAMLPRSPFAGAAPEETRADAPRSFWSGLWWSVPLLGAAGLGAVLVLRRREPAIARATPPALRSMQVADAADHRAMLRNGQAAVVRGAHAEAIAWFDAALVAAPKLAVAHFCRGVCLASMGRTAEAYGALEEAVANDPSDASYRIHFARVAIALGRGTDAMAALEPVASAIPEIQQAMLEDPQLSGLRDHPRFLAMCGAL